ncbi:MAG TPA: hypothetical protein VGP13_03070 [Candidatus Paceibacterota bacterium]|nr:hypothetical protein [Candidatus Paceibacterota bacterium]
MNTHRFENAFRRRKAVFLIALHVTPHEQQWSRDIDIARGEGADGILVIRDYTTTATDDDALAVYHNARKRYPHWHIGLNLLDHQPLAAILRVKTGVSSFWFDEPQINEGQPDGAKYFANVRLTSDVAHVEAPPLLMPCVAMKYKIQPKSIATVAKLVEPYADVILTSGDKTGMPADIEKVQKLRQAVQGPIGLCSGVSAENVGQFIDEGVTCFVIWSSIAKKDKINGETIERLDWPKVGEMRDKIPR